MDPRAVSTALLVAALVGACGGGLPGPRIGPHPESASNYVQVPYPPPPARVEFVPPKPSASAVWIDGQWNWQGRRWVWEPGGWVNAPSGVYFAPWAIVLGGGTFYFLPGSWHDEKTGAEVAAPALLVTAAPGPAGEAP